MYVFRGMQAAMADVVVVDESGGGSGDGGGHGRGGGNTTAYKNAKTAEEVCFSGFFILYCS